MSEHLNATARLLQHRSSPVTFDPPVTEDSIARAQKAADDERQEIWRYAALRDDHKLLLSHMRDIHGAQQIRDWLDGLDAIEANLRRG